MLGYNKDLEQYIKNLQADHYQDLEKLKTREEYEIEALRSDLDNSERKIWKLKAQLEKKQTQNKKLCTENLSLKARLDKLDS